MATVPDTPILMESSSPSGTITAGDDSDNSLRTLTPQLPLDITEPVMSLLVDPIVTIEDLQRQVTVKQKVASSDNILTSTRRLQTSRGYSSMDALNDSTSIRTSVTQQAINIWDSIVYYLKKHVNSGRRQPPLKFKYYRNCFFGSELITCLRTCVGHSVKDELGIHVLCSKLLQSGVIEGVEESRGKLLFISTELYRFTSEPSESTKLNTESSTQQRKRFIPLGLQTSTMKAMFNIWKLWKKHVSMTSQATPQATYPLEPRNHAPKTDQFKNRPRNRTHHTCQCKKHGLSAKQKEQQLKRSNSFDTLLEYKAGKSDWVVYGFL